MRFAGVLGLLWLCAQPVLAQELPEIFALHIGVNKAPVGSSLQSLNYADDDAARFYLLTREISRRSELLTVFDQTSLRRLHALGPSTRPPNSKVLSDVLQVFAVEMAAARRMGRRVVLIVTYSGHGSMADRVANLTLLDGPLDSNFFSKQLVVLPTHASHLFIDACHSEGVLAQRGVIKGERNAVASVLPGAQADRTFGRTFFRNNPNIGAIFSASQNNVSHEWSELEAGLFSYEVFSALSGAADINADGKIDYSEVAAFLAAANRDIADPTVALRVVSEPPRDSAAGPILDLAWFRHTPVLESVASTSGHITLRRQDGMRLCDAHIDAGLPFRILLLSRHNLSLVRGDGLQAQFQPSFAQRVVLERLAFAKPDTIAQRSGTLALRRGFFARPYNRAFYEGFVASTGMPAVQFFAPPPSSPELLKAEPPAVAQQSLPRRHLDPPKPPGPERALDYVGLGLGSAAGVGVVGTAVFCSLSALKVFDYAAVPGGSQQDAIAAGAFAGIAAVHAVVAVGFGVTTALWYGEQ